MEYACSLLVALLLVVPASAQIDGSDSELRRARGWLDAPRDLSRELGLDSYSVRAFGDIDGDGLTDLLAIRSSVNPILPIWNRGNDEYEVGQPFGTSSSIYVRILADFTGNGRPDLVTDHNGAPPGLFVHENVAGTFAPPFQIDTVDRRPWLAFAGELDGDAAHELVVVDRDFTTLQDYFVRWLNWNGSTFVSSTGAAIGPAVASIATGDLNGNGRDDVLVGMLDTEQILVFETASDGSLALIQTVDVTVGSSLIASVFVAAGDFDGDGDTDALAAYRDGVDTAFQVLRNDGAPPLVPEPPQLLASGFGTRDRLFPADWDEDGDLDVVRGGQTVQFFENLGNAIFRSAAGVPIRNGVGPPVGVTDLNGDGYLDFVGQLCVKSGNGHFEDLAAELPGNVDFGRPIDIDGDDDLDVVSRFGRVLENDGAGSFTLGDIEDRFDPPPPTTNFSVTSLGDFTGDGRLDFLAGFGGPFNSGVALARGTEGYLFEYGGPAAAVNVRIGHANLIELPPVDLDGDGDLDVIDKQGWGENDGTAYFTRNDVWDANTFATADVDLDGDVDVAASASGTATLLRNNGDGTFVASQLSDTSSGEIHFVDLDADGSPEFVTSTHPPTIRVFANQGGEFSGVPLVLPTPSFTQDFHAFDDFDGDGRLDILGTRPRFESNGGEPTLIWRQLPGPGLAFANPRYHYTEVRPVVRGDFDGDGDLDLLRERMIRSWRFNAGRDGKIRRVNEPPLDGGFVQPQLTAHGALVAGSRLTFTVTNAPGPGWIVISDRQQRFRAVLSAGPGRGDHALELGDGLAGAELFVRSLFLDPASRVFRRSNALELKLAE